MLGITTFVCLQTEFELKSYRPYKEISLELKKDLQFIHFPIVGTTNFLTS